jgi:hypothetical protein
MNEEQMVERELARKAQVLEESPSHYHFVYHKSHIFLNYEIEPGLPRLEAGDKTFVPPTCLR